MPSLHPVAGRDILEPHPLCLLVGPDELGYIGACPLMAFIDVLLVFPLELRQMIRPLLRTGGAQAGHQIGAVELLATVPTVQIANSHFQFLPKMGYALFARARSINIIIIIVYKERLYNYTSFYGGKF